MHAIIASNRLRAGAVAVLALGWLVVAATSASAWTVNSARLERTGEMAVLRLATDGAGDPLPHDVFILEDPWRVVVDLFGADAPLPAEDPGATAPPGLVQGVRWSLWKNDPADEIVRYVIDCGGPVQFRVEPSSGSLAVFVSPGSAVEETQAAAVPAPEAAAETNEPDDCIEEERAAALAGSDAAPTMVTTSLQLSLPETIVPEPPSVAASRPPAPLPTVLPPVEMPVVLPTRQDAAPSLGAADAGAASQAGRPMNLDVQGADIRTVLRSIAEYGGANIAADRDVDGPVAVRLSQVPWRQALDVVCQSAGLVALEKDGVIRVATAKALRDEGLEKESSERKREELAPLQTRVFNIRYASAKELRDAVVFVLSKRGSANVDERTNAILVSDIEPRVAEVEKLVTTLDTETRQVEITARLVDVDRTVARQLGIQWSLDNLHSNSERVSGSASVDEPLATASGQLRLGVVRGFGNLDATIEALERENRASLISSPKITTVNNRKARILVGKEVPLIILDVAGNPTTELKKVGISLEVTPYINSENRITMDLKPEVSDLSSQATVQGGIVFTTTLADTRVMVNNGETAVIGGLIRTGETKFSQGIPVLSSLPLLGTFFRSSDTRKENRELLIFVSPRVVEGVAENR